MMFTHDEAKALVASVRMAQVWLDPALAQSAEDALGKILSVLPADARVAAEALAVYAPPGGLPQAAQRTLQTLREAVHERCKVFINYRDLSDKPSERTLRPLGCFYWGKVWTLAAWCEQRNDFRSFRVDRVTYVRRLDERFRDEPGRTLADLARLNEAHAREQGWAT
jgi:predicted DNA-binding transcriptional regulator YafY